VPDWQELVALLLSWLAIAAAGTVIVLILRTFVPSAESIPQRRRAVSWTSPLVGLAFLVFLFTPSYVLHFLGQPKEQPAKDIAGCLAQLIALPIQLVLWLALHQFARGWRTEGYEPRHAAVAYRLGFRTWLILTPVVYGVSFAAIVVYTWVVGNPPEEHSIIQILQRGPVSFDVAAILFVQAVFAAPIKEEMFFRGILQPWLATKPWGGHLALWLAAVVGVLLHSPATTDASAATPALFVLAVLPAYWLLDRCDLSRWLPIHDPVARLQAARAIVGTSLLFANFHANFWPTPVPLFVLSLGLGWLAYRTQSVIAPIVLHMLFNAIVFATLAIKATLPLTAAG
jgi:membrane protease YdiL (CAAX protease family)